MNYMFARNFLPRKCYAFPRIISFDICMEFWTLSIYSFTFSSSFASAASWRFFIVKFSLDLCSLFRAACKVPSFLHNIWIARSVSSACVYRDPISFNNETLSSPVLLSNSVTFSGSFRDQFLFIYNGTACSCFFFFLLFTKRKTLIIPPVYNFL